MPSKPRASYRFLVNAPVEEVRRERLMVECRRIEAQHFGTEPEDVRVDITEIEPGKWFTSAEPSQATFVTVTIPDHTEQQARVALMTDIGASVAGALDQDFHAVMVVAADGRRPRT